MTICAVLVGEPWHLSLEEIGDLTPWQTQEIYFHARDEHGCILIPGTMNSQATTAERAMKAFVSNCRVMGLSDEEIDAKWEAHIDRLASIGQPSKRSLPPPPS